MHRSFILLLIAAALIGSSFWWRDKPSQPGAGPVAPAAVSVAPPAVSSAENPPPEPESQPEPQSAEPAAPAPSTPEKEPLAAPAGGPLAHLQSVVETLAQAPAVATGTVGFYLADAAAPGQPLAAHNARQSFITASTIKTITTGAALELLGPDFQFATPLLCDEATGDLIIKGAGDPSLARGGWDGLFAEWLAALRAAGLAEVRGRVVADESAWESQDIPDGWVWLDIGNYYAPPLTPLTFHDNEFRVYFKLAGAPGDPAGFTKAEPWPDGLQFTDEVKIGAPGTGDNAYVFGTPGAARYVLRGTLAADAGKEYIRAALPDPALFAAQRFTQFLQQNGLPVKGAPDTTRRLAAGGALPDHASARTLATHHSAPLRELLAPINHKSLNLDCECLLRVLGEGRAAAGLGRIRGHLAAKGLPLAGFEQTDGSGLSRTNMITPELLARANGAVLDGPQGGIFLASLPILGARGSTLRSLGGLSGGAVIHAKSGTIERVKGYTGRVDAADGRRYIFAVLVNNYDGSYSRDVQPHMAALFEALGNL